MLWQRHSLMLMAGENNPFGAPSEQETPEDNDDVFEVEVPNDDGDSKFRVPATDYPARVVDLFKDTSSAGNAMYVWEFELLWPRSVRGKTFRNFTALTPAAMWKLTEVLEALGLGEKGKKAKFKKEDAIGRMAIVSIEDQEYKGQMRSSIAKISPMSQAQKEKLSELRAAAPSKTDTDPFAGAAPPPSPDEGKSRSGEDDIPF